MFLTLIGCINLAISTTISLILLSVFGLINPYSKICQNIFYYWSLIALKLAGVKIDIHGLEHVDPNKGYVLCSNHLHIFDIPVLCVASKLNLRFAAKKELFKIPVFGQAITLIGMIKIDRGNSKEALKELKKVEEVIDKHKVAVGIFAEGTRNTSGRGLLEFKKGAFMMSMNTHQELLPVTVNGTNKILQGIRVKPRTVNIHFHAPVNPKQYPTEKRDQFMAEVRKTILSKLDDK